MPSPRALCAPVACGLLAVSNPMPASAEPLELGDAVREALESNLDLAARRRALAADAEEVELAGAQLLPQIALAARAQRMDADRSDAERGETTRDSITFAGKGSRRPWDRAAEPRSDLTQPRDIAFSHRGGLVE